MMDGASAHQDSDTSQHPLSRAVIIAVLAASLMVGAFAISTQSYWIDEATSLIVAMASKPADAWKYAQAVGGSTIQMPLYHVYLYAWHKVFGSSEWAMRASNIPWLMLGQLAFLILLRDRPRLALVASLLAALSPTIWAYLDEARPYLIQYAAGCWFVAAIVRLSSTTYSGALFVSRTLFTALIAAAIVLFGSSLLGVVWASGFIGALLWLWLTRPQEQPSAHEPSRSIASVRRSYVIPSIVFAAATLLLLAYYLWTWPMAGRGYHRAGLSLISLPYVAYEFLGFAGYGPGKLQLRTSIVGSLMQHIPSLLPLGIVLAALVLIVAWQTRISSVPRRTTIAWMIALLLPSLVILTFFLFASYRPLPRHFIPALPAVILALSAALLFAWAQRNALCRGIAVLLPLLWLGSSLSLRGRDIHAKDDYRTAAAIAAAALEQNKEVWWAADAAAAYIYLTPVALQEIPGRAWAMQAPSWDDIRFKFPPRVIVISKPDIYDPQGAVARYAAENRFVPAKQLQAFTIFTREGEQLPAVTP